MARKIEIDAEACMGSGNCSFWAPNTFDLSDQGIAEVIDPEGDEWDKVLGAVDGCPTSAIAAEARDEDAG